MRSPFFDVWWSCRASCEEVWEVLADTTRWPEWGPSVRAVESTERFVSAGTAGRVRTPFGFWIPFQVDECTRPHRWSWQVAGISATGHRVEKREGGCRVVFEVPLFAFPYGLVCLVAARRISRLAGKVSEGGP